MEEITTYYTFFKVDDTPYCCWEEKKYDRNIEFLDSIDVEYFNYIVETHRENLNNENKQYAAFTLRQTYRQALETLFSLICASIQSPKCVYGWIEMSKPGTIRKIIRQLSNNDNTLFNLINLKEISWESYTNKLFFIENNTDEKIIHLSKRFCNFLKRLSHDYTSDYNIKEYNSFKHGFRLKPGGFKIKISPKENKSLEQLSNESKFGSSFLVLKEIEGINSKKNLHYRSRRYLLNWNPDNIITAISLITLSIENIITFIKLNTKGTSQIINYRFPTDLEAFSLPWEGLLGIQSMSFSKTITREMINEFTKDEINNKLNSIWEKNNYKNLSE